MNEFTRKDTSSHWSAYWQSGSLTSLPQDFKQNYDGELADYWNSVLEGLSESASIVDVCTGNLALPLLLSELNKKNKKNLKLQAVDLATIVKEDIANIHPGLAHHLAGIDLIHQTAIEEIYKKISQPVDLITSQYGLEYCVTETIAPQLFNLLKPGGRLVFVSHAADTDILKSMQEEKRAFDILQELKVFSTLKSYGDGQFQPAYFNKKIKKQLIALHRVLVEKPAQLLQIFHQALGGLSQLSLKQLATQKDAVKQFYQQHWMAQMRASDLLWVCQKIANNPTWYQAFETAGLTLEQQKTIWYRGKHNAGIAYQFIKPHN